MGTQNLPNPVPRTPRPDGFPSPAPAKKFGLLFKIGLAFFGVLISLALIEIAFRLVGSRLSPTPPRSDRPETFYLAEDSRDGPDFERIPAKRPGEFRILILGDSFTYGQNCQPEDSFPSRLERRLNMNNAQPYVRVLNWGVKGYSTVQEVHLLKKALSSTEVKPDLVILEITLNDPEVEPFQVSHRDEIRERRLEMGSGLLRHWHSLRFVVERVINTRTHSEYVEYFLDLFSNASTWKHFHDALLHFHSTLADNSIPGFAVVFPLFSHPLGDNYPFRSLHEKTIGALNEIGISNLDLLPDFRGIPIERLQVDLGHDSHPNEIAYRIAADSIYRELIQRHLVPASAEVKNTAPKR